MVETNGQFQKELVHALGAIKDDMGFAEIKGGEDEVLVTIEIPDMSVTLHPCRLDVVRTDDQLLTVYLRNVTVLGSPGALLNRAVSYTEDVFVRRAQVRHEKVGRNDIELAGLLIDMFCAKPRSFEDLMLMCLSAINFKMRGTRSAVDFDDGEVVVIADMFCDFQETPKDFERNVKATLGHAVLIQQLERGLRKFAFADPKPSADLVSILCDRVSRSVASKEECNEMAAEDPLTI